MSNRSPPGARLALSGMMGRWRAGACPRDAMTLRSLLSTSTSVNFGKLCALSAAVCLCALPACGDDDAGPIVSPDAGMADLGPPDLGTPDLGPMYAPGTTCDDPHVLAGTTTGEVSLSFDTTDERPGMRDIGFECGNAEAERWAPQHVVEYAVPGTGLQRVEFSTVNPGTGRRVDTVVQVRATCDRVPSPFFSCFDNASSSELRSIGATSATGGSTIYFIVTTVEDTMATGWSDRGPIELTVSARSMSAPTITAGSVYAIGSRVEFNATGGDADGDAVGMRAQFLDATGEPVDLDANGTVDENDVPKRRFATSPSSMMTFSGTAEFEGLTGFIGRAPVRATQVDLSIYDSAAAQSSALRLPLVALTEGGTGATCDDTVRCRRPLVCDAALCAPTPEYVALCAAATPVAIAIPTDMATTATVSGSAGAAADRFAPFTCTNSDGTRLAVTGGEVLYSVTLPAGTYDLTARTDVTGTASTDDTIVYLRRDCADPGGELACNDDLSAGGMDLRSRVDVRDLAAGTYHIFVEPFRGGTTVVFSLEVRLRPVLATGATCDPEQLLNRCAAGACLAGATPTCP